MTIGQFLGLSVTPYWCTGENADSFVIVAYAESEDEIRSLWPEVSDFDLEEEVEQITFTSRFPKPDWYNEKLVDSIFK